MLFDNSTLPQPLTAIMLFLSFLPPSQMFVSEGKDDLKSSNSHSFAWCVCVVRAEVSHSGSLASLGACACICTHAPLHLCARSQLLVPTPPRLALGRAGPVVEHDELRSPETGELRREQCTACWAWGSGWSWARWLYYLGLYQEGGRKLIFKCFFLSFSSNTE